jgi:hypothetical protein
LDITLEVESMAIEHINRKGRKYYLHESKTKTGKPKYFFSMKSEGNLIDIIPAGYEIYENPNAQVFLRKPPRQIITPEEIEIVREGVRKYSEVEYFLVDVKDKHIIVYLCDQNVEVLTELTSYTFGKNFDQTKAAIARCLNYSPMMQFVLSNAETREFTVERWCFLGAIDDWISLDHSKNLLELVKTYAPHLGKESFYDLI